MRPPAHPSRRFRGLFAAAAVGLLGGCASPSVTGDVQGEPVCADFELGSTKTRMKGALKNPVKVTILEDDDPRWERILLGKRSADDPDSKFVVPDSDEEYTVRWAQCENVFAPKRTDEGVDPNAKRGGGYACGEAKPYKDVELKVEGGNPASRVIQWQAPPLPACWQSTELEPASSASAEVEDEPPDGAGGSGGGAGGGGGAAGGGGAKPSASASASAAPEPAPPKPESPEPKPPAPKPKPKAPQPATPKPASKPDSAPPPAPPPPPPPPAPAPPPATPVP